MIFQNLEPAIIGSATTSLFALICSNPLQFSKPVLLKKRKHYHHVGIISSPNNAADFISPLIPNSNIPLTLLITGRTEFWTTQLRFLD
jgi:hypothetical protein